MEKNTLFVIDAYNLIYRMFYAIPEMHMRDGRPVNAIFGVAKFLKALSEENPQSHILVATDVGRSFRAELFQDYKGTRERMPDNLRSQIDGVFSLFESARIPVLAREGYEADDIIGSIAVKHTSESLQVVIISSDKDLCQFVRDGQVHIYDAMKQKFMKECDVIEKFGVPSHQVSDYLAIVGDSADNIPGILGFGPKKAADLLSRYGSLDAVYQDIGIDGYQLGGAVVINEEKRKQSTLTDRVKNGLIEQVEQAFLSQKLATILVDLDIDVAPFCGLSLSENITFPEYLDLLRKYEFRSLVGHIERPNIPYSMPESVENIFSKEELISWIDQEKTLYIACFNDRVCTFRKECGDLAQVDLMQVDIASDLIDLLHSDGLMWIGYDLKSILIVLYGYKNPSYLNEGQSTLF